MNIFDQIKATQAQYKFERRAGPRYARPFFEPILHRALNTIAEFWILCERVDAGEYPAHMRKRYLDHINDNVEAIRLIKDYLGLTSLDLFELSQQTIANKTSK